MTTEDPARVAATTGSVRVWDWPVRVSHWLIAVLFVVSWFSAENGLMQVHFVSGLSILGVLLFRLSWAFMGSTNARFADFAPTPGRISGYLKRLREPGYRPGPGHSPLGGLSVLALWAVLGVHLTLGLFAVDTDGLYSGPLASMVSFETGREAAEVHETTFTVLLVLIGLHVAAIAYFLVGKRTNLIPAMVTGRSRAHREEAQLLPARKLAVRSVAGILLAAGIIYWIAG